MAARKKRETWNSQLGVILAVTGSAVGLANFLRFPGQAAQFGGGAFMLAYFISLIVLALPIAWAEWTMGRYGGQHGFSSCPGIFNVIAKNRSAKYFGILGVLVPLVIYMYYSYVESWCLGYAINFITGKIHFTNIKESESFWLNFIGGYSDGSAIGFGMQQVGFYLLIAFLINFTLIYRGVSRGIELFCKYAVPSLIIIALVVLVRVLTLGAPDANNPEQNVTNGLGFMWNPTKVYVQQIEGNQWTSPKEIIGTQTIEKYTLLAKQYPANYRIETLSIGSQLKKPKLWLAAASQVFFSLSVGLGLIITYASYMKKDDDVVLSSLTASSANEFCEVGIGGMMSLPAAYAYLGAAGVVGQTVFGLGFKALPMVFSSMQFGQIFGFLFFFLLFLAAVNASISCLQPSIAFLEESLNIGRKRSVSILSAVTATGCSFVVWFSQDAMALDSLDFWAGNFLVFVIATTQIILFGWVFGVDKGLKEANRGAAIKIPSYFKIIIKYICPGLLLAIFIMWITIDVLGVGGNSIDKHITDLTGSSTNPPSIVAWISISIIVTLFCSMAIIISRSKSFKLKRTK